MGRGGTRLPFPLDSRVKARAPECDVHMEHAMRETGRTSNPCFRGQAPAGPQCSSQTLTLDTL